MIREICQRSQKGLHTTSILRILQASTHSILMYGIEIWGHDTELTKTADSFMYGALKRLFDLLIAPPPPCHLERIWIHPYSHLIPVYMRSHAREVSKI